MSVTRGNLQRRTVRAFAAVIVVVLSLAISATAVADTGVKAERADLLARAMAEGRALDLTVHSPSMNRDVPVRVLVAADTSVPRPTLYLLNGSGGGEGDAHWFVQTDIVKFAADKNVNIVVPMSGGYSYYTDWVKVDPNFGINKWTTFLTRELPPVIDQKVNGSGANGIAGISMAGTSVLALAESAPDLYRTVAAYSGCAETSTRLGQLAVQAVVGERGDVRNMWGPVGGPGWRDHDPVINAHKLRGKAIYVSSGTGLPGRHDRLANEAIDGDVAEYARIVGVGGPLEAATYYCTQNLDKRLKQLRIPATFDYEPGTHSWPYWQDQLAKSWPMLERALTR
ncbi:putative mycolyltransferase [Gordonia namibiensis NBRC 108229]|uniref:Putative mycolyltransferase n=1 Tax=Gordonia namibiensis NBRC 108229 TaxID=1208314 RepID=K6WNW7_9ACTN|nr:alpha/beta hydrolase family protein [Gordonia namibiensis]GAC01121.1 putative mycolyltransferase [Gordonia namibiensis NBRC 108229]